MTRLGMDVDVVDSVGKQLKQRGGSLQQVIQTVDGLINRADQDWWGRKGQQFVHEWRSVHRPALAQAAAAVTELSETALRNVAEQRQASAADQGATGGGQWSGVSPGLPADLSILPAYLATRGPAPGAFDAGRNEYVATVDDVNGFLTDVGYARGKQVLDFLDSAAENPVAKKILDYGPLKVLNAADDVATIARDVGVLTDESRGFEDRFFAFTDATSKTIGLIPGPVGTLGSMAIDVYTEGAQVAMVTDWSREAAVQAADYVLGIKVEDTDFSAKGAQETLQYAVSNPGVVAEETVKAIAEVPGMLQRLTGWW